MAHGCHQTAPEQFEGMTQFADFAAVAALVELMLPLLDGLSVLQQLREAGKNGNVLILSARDQVVDRIREPDLVEPAVIMPCRV
jgi:DNA-binding response OmpR family regulator